MKLGVDTGGTFTDFVLHDGHDLRRYKLSSTPDDPSRAIARGLRHFFGESLPPDLTLVHGTTVGTNAFLERKGAKVLLVTTHGFEDVLFIGRQNRAALYDLNSQRPRPVLERCQVTGVKERILHDGTVEQPLGRTVGRRVAALARRIKAEAVVICLLHSYANPCHEEQLAAQLAHLDLPVILSSRVLPEFREYERFSTTVVNGYLTPIMARYVQRLQDYLGDVALSIQQSNGGIMPARHVRQRAVHTVLSGPAGGVQGAWQLARLMGRRKFLTFDMGGTSTDVSLCDGEPALTREYSLDGFPIHVPLLDIHTVGAGGGSIAHVDEGGLLHVGPQSAGADPGPASYGKGDDLTVTDANLLLGRLRPDFFLAGRMSLDLDRARRLMGALAADLGMSVEQCALGIIRIVNAGMVKAMRAVSLERGHDPADFSLFSFGGASGLHCCELAEELGVAEIIIPARAGILSAQGMVFNEPTLDKSRSLFLAGDALTEAAFSPLVAELEQELAAEMAGLRLGGQPIFSAFIDLRYVGQSHEIEVAAGADFRHRFHQAHELAFGYCLPEKELECVSLRCRARLPRPAPSLPAIPSASSASLVADGEVDVVLSRGREMIPLYHRHHLLAGQQGSGPCLVVDDYTTLFITPGFHFFPDESGALILTNQAYSERNTSFTFKKR